LTMFTIYTYPGNPRANKSLIAAQYAGVKIDVPSDFVMGVTNETPEFLAKFPLGKVPCMMTPQGPLYESNAMARYVAGLRADNTLLGSSHYESGLVDQWIHWAQNDVDAPVGVLVYPILGYMQYNKKAYDIAKGDLNNALSLLNNHLQSQTFLVGERVSLADISLVCSLQWAFNLVIDSAAQAKYANVTRWYLTCVNQPEFAAVMGEVKLAVEEVKADKPKEEKKKEEKPKEEKKKEEKPKEEKKKSKKDDDEEEEEVLKEEKPRLSEEETAWLAQKSPMELENVKRFLSNNKFADAQAQFWTDFDFKVYSVWECDYNYNNDNTIEWMTANLMGGFINRLEESRKISYGALTMCGNKPYHLQGVFVFKYKEVPTYVKECPDYESYTFKQLDVTTAEGKARFAEIWDAATVDGRELKERRFFK